MTTPQPQESIKVQVPDGGALHAEFMGAGGQLYIGDRSYSVNQTGLVVPENDQKSLNLAQRALDVGQCLRNGTIVLYVDPDNDKALFVPTNIFGGVARFDKQDNVVESVNDNALHGHRDWRRITDEEGHKLANNWVKVTKKDPEWFWIASPNTCAVNGMRHGRIGVSLWYDHSRRFSLAVPVVRSGPARNLDI